MNEITPAELAALGSSATIIDVRQPEEFAEVRVAGAELVPLGELPARFMELPADETLYIMCRSGGRSAQATAFLDAQGFEAVNVRGGMIDWVGAGLPVESGPSDGR